MATREEVRKTDNSKLGREVLTRRNRAGEAFNLSAGAESKAVTSKPRWSVEPTKKTKKTKKKD